MEQFEELFRKLQDNQIETARNGGKKIKTIMSTRLRLLMVLHWLREKPKLRLMAQKFEMSIGTIHADIEVCSVFFFLGYLVTILVFLAQINSCHKKFH